MGRYLSDICPGGVVTESHHTCNSPATPAAGWGGETTSMSKSLERKVAIVTGAAGEKGMGRAIALTLAEAGADVAVCDNVFDVYDRNLEARAEEIRKLGRRSLAVQADVSKKTDVDNMVQKVADELGPVDILVNNAGTIRVSRVLETDEDSWDIVVDVNLKGCFLCSRAVAKGMAERGSGSIVNISSTNGLTAFPAPASYSASKAGIIMLTRSLAREWGSYNIRVNAVAPGAIATDWVSHIEDMPVRTVPRELSGIRIPLERRGEPSEVGSAVLFLASDAASYVTGHTLVVDGGMLA